MKPQLEIQRDGKDERWSDLGVSSPTTIARGLDVIHFWRGVRMIALDGSSEQYFNLWGRKPEQLVELEHLLSQIARSKGKKRRELMDAFEERTGVPVKL